MQGQRGKVRVAIVGAGFGGLSAAIRLQAAGLETVLFEARAQAGGRAGVWRDQGFTFDTGPSVITAPESIEELYGLADLHMADHISLQRVDPFYRLMWFDGDVFDYGGDKHRMHQQIRQRNPSDVEGYERFIEYSKRNFQAGYNELVSTAFLRMRDMARAAPKLFWLRSDRSVYKSVSRFVQDERLRQALSFHTLLIGGSPFETSSIYTLIHHLENKWGIHYPKGGTGALVEALVKLYQQLGGELRLACPVRHIDVRKNGKRPVHVVTTAMGSTEAFDLSVSNADLFHTYSVLFGHDPRSQPMIRKLMGMQWSMSLFLCYFGVRRRYDDLKQHTIFFGPRYEKLIQNIFHGNSLAQDFSLYLHAPSVTDPSLAPAGCETFYVLSPVQHLGLAPLDWPNLAPIYADRILAALERFLPNLRREIVTLSYFTPLDFQYQYGAFMGNGFSVSPLLTQSAYFRPHNRDPRIPGLYIVGAGTHPGAGVPGVINSAKATARVILEDLARS